MRLLGFLMGLVVIPCLMLRCCLCMACRCFHMVLRRFPVRFLCHDRILFRELCSTPLYDDLSSHRVI